MRQVNLRNGRAQVLRPTSGTLSTGEISPELRTDNFRSAVFDLDVAALSTPGGGDTVDFFFQTKINGRWQDFANIHFATADNGTTPKRTLLLGPPKEGVSAPITPTDATIAINTQNANMPLGESVRVKTAVAGAPTYSYTVTVSLLG